MKDSWQPKLNKSVRQNARQIIPLMFDKFFMNAADVIGHPRSVREFHTMRVIGKPLRYTMEFMSTGFGKKFNACYLDVKNLIDLMGKTHDCDMAIPIIQEYLEEIRVLNRNVTPGSEKFSVTTVTELLRSLQQRRRALFTEVSNCLVSWKRENFRTRLVHSMK